MPSDIGTLALDVLNRMPFGVVIGTTSCEPAFANGAARGIADSRFDGRLAGLLGSAGSYVHRVTSPEATLAAVLLFDGDVGWSLDRAWLAGTFGLSAAEAGIAESLTRSNGSLSAAAAERAVSRNTIKTQAKSLYAKIGANSAVDVVRLLLKSPAILQTNDGLFGGNHPGG